MDAIALGIVYAYRGELKVGRVGDGLGLNLRLGLGQRGGEEVVVVGGLGCDDGKHGERGLVGGRREPRATFGVERWRGAKPSVYLSTPHAMTPLTG